MCCLSGSPDYLAQLGKVYCNLGYLTQSLQAHRRALNINKPEEPKHQVSRTDSFMCNSADTVLLAFESLLAQECSPFVEYEIPKYEFPPKFYTFETMETDHNTEAPFIVQAEDIMLSLQSSSLVCFWY